MPLNASILKENLNPTFIETGTYRGGGVEAALEAGFGRIWSVDLDGERRWDSGVLESHPSVTFAAGDSAMLLNEMLGSLEGSATFWLDAHPVGHFDLLQPDLPLVNELLAISFHPRKQGDIILIDDIRLFTEDDRTRLRDFIHILWPDCVTDLIDSSIIPNDILRVRHLT